MTWVLQPCDTHVFALFKNTLQAECEGVMLRLTANRMSLDMTFEALLNTVTKILRGRNWSKAFWDTGLTGYQQRGVSQRVIDKLQMSAIPHIGHELPTLAQLVSIWPKNAIPIDAVFFCLYYGPYSDFYYYQCWKRSNFISSC